MDFWPQNFIPSLQAHGGLTIAAAIFGVALAVLLKWRTLRDLFRRSDDDEEA